MTPALWEPEVHGENDYATAVARLDLRDFRLFERTTLEPSLHVNVVCGANAQGKTTLLEAVHLVSTGRLLRGPRDAHAVRHGAESARVEAELTGAGTTVSVVLRAGFRKRVEVNGLGLPRASDVIGRLPSVSFSAADLAVSSGEPADRRQFLDWELAQVSPAYLRHLTVYKRSLEHRNALLRQAQDTDVPSNVFEPWEHRLAESGAAMRQAREGYVGRLSGGAAAAHAAMGGGEQLTVAYQAKDEGWDAASLNRLLEAGRADDVRRGATGCGPHRDDLLLSVEGQEARYYGSQGQQRTAVIAVKLAVLDLVRATFGHQPLLLLDDVFSDLDAHRRRRLMELTLGRGGQVFISCTEPELGGSDLLGSATVFKVESGCVVPL